MDFRDLIDGFQFDDNRSLHKQIQPEGFTVRLATILEADCLLALNLQAARDQLSRENGLVHAFQQSGAKGPVNVQRGIDDVWPVTSSRGRSGGSWWRFIARGSLGKGWKASWLSPPNPREPACHPLKPMRVQGNELRRGRRLRT